MNGFWIVIAIIVVGFLLFLGKKTTQAFNAFDEAKPWFVSQGIDINSVKFTPYSDPKLVKFELENAIALVCIAKKITGETVGIVLEVAQGQGVIDYEYLIPEGIASQHVKAMQIAKANGEKLMNVISDMAYEHRKKHNM